ncbi:phosphatase PAP2 family protein [Chloroflexota bacterium]
MRRFHWLVCGIFLVMFGVFAYLARQSFSFPGDVTVCLRLQGLSLPFLYPLMRAISAIHSLLPAIVVVAVVSGGLWFSGRRLETTFIISLTSLATLLNWLLKLLIGRPRPGSKIQVLTENSGFSFPSGHIVYAVVFYGFLFYLAPRLIKQLSIVRLTRFVLVLLILVTAVSRVYLGAHWLSDALGSFWLGGLLLIPSVNFYNNYAGGKNA